jgi:hypothetical protein
MEWYSGFMSAIPFYYVIYINLNSLTRKEQRMEPKDIYLKRKVFEAKFNPSRNIERMNELHNPELFINPHTTAHYYTHGFKYNVPEKVCIECSLVITNEEHDGVWLVMDDLSEKVDLPGGFVNEEDWRYASMNPYYVIYNTIIRSMADANPMLRYSRDFDSYFMLPKIPHMNQFRTLLGYVMDKYGLPIDTNVKDHLLFYIYRTRRVGLPTGMALDPTDDVPHLHVLVLVETPYPDYSIPPFSNYMSRYMVWYSRKEHRMVYNTSADRRALLCSPYDDDIRTEKQGLITLDAIFNNESQFGKLDIY